MMLNCCLIYSIAPAAGGGGESAGIHEEIHNYNLHTHVVSHRVDGINASNTPS